jgi:hypothetical protein
MQCKTCMFWDTFGYEKPHKGELAIGDCFRYPPAALKNDMQYCYGRPVVDELNWCGEWRVKKSTKNHRPTTKG